MTNSTSLRTKFDDVPVTKLTGWQKFRRNKGITYIVLTLIAIIWVFPFVWMVLGSFKTQKEILAQPPTFFCSTPNSIQFCSMANSAEFRNIFYK